MQTETVRRGDERLGQGGIPTDRVAAQAFSSFNSATVVTVARDTEVAKPIEIAVTGPGEGAVAYGHLQIRVEELARAIVVVDLRGSGTYADNVEIIVGDSAALGVIWLADWADDTVHVSAHHARLGKDSVLGHVNVTLGGDLVRTSTTVRFTAPGGDAQLLGTYFADDGQHFESRLLVDHAQPNCRSDVLYKGALQADPDSDRPDAHTVWVGDVLIRAEATGTDTLRRTATWCSPTAPAPTRCPTSRSRRARSSAPDTQVPPGDSTTSSCSTCRLAVSRKSRPAD